MYQKTEGLVLREVDYKEADRLLTVLTKDSGKLTLKARGVRKSKGTLKSACQLLTYSEFTYSERNGYCTITEAVPIQMFTELRADLELLSLASYLAQVTDVAAMEGEPNQELLSLTLNALYALSVLHKPQKLVKAGFELRAACIMGYTPDLSFCAGCGSETPSRFLLREGVLLCDTCAKGESEGIRMPVSPAALAAMRYLTECPANRLFSFSLSETAQDELSAVTEAYLLSQLERGFSTLDFYKSLFLHGDHI
jgi:DNA repair protein RecO (recombination protein O)